MAHALRKSKHKSLQHINRNTNARTTAWVQSTIGISSSYLDNYIKEHVLYPCKKVSNFKYVIIIILDDWCKHYTTKFMQTKETFLFHIEDKMFEWTDVGLWAQQLNMGIQILFRTIDVKKTRF